MTGENPYRVTRVFALASLAGILSATLLLGVAFDRINLAQLVEHESRHNAQLARTFINSVWEKHRGFVQRARGMSREALQRDPAAAALRADVLAGLRGIKVADVRLYDVDGRLVFSMDERQAGTSGADRSRVEAALAGTPQAELHLRGEADESGGRYDRDLVGSYVPVRTLDAGGVEAVFEIYSDVGDLLATRGRALAQAAGAVALVFAAFCALLLGMARKADATIAAQRIEGLRREELVRHQGYHDSLTGLPNRRYFTERIGEEVAKARRFGGQFTLMYIDVDRFKIVNDSLGHNAGDWLLHTVAYRLKSCLRTGDLLFRMGGDEFSIIVPRPTPPEEIAHMAQRYIEAVSAPADFDGNELNVGISVGIALCPADGEDAEVLGRNADSAMNEAKDSGRGTYAFYRRELTERVFQNMQLESALRRALRNEEFVVYYQPRYDAQSRAMVALEALLRWHSPERGVVQPHEFLPAVESGRMTVAVGEWVLRRVCAQVKAWHDAGVAPLRVSINIASAQFHDPGFTAMVEQVLKASGTPPEALEFELTETLLIQNPESAIAILRRLKELGVIISMDDFGTGYSSLSYLRMFPVDYLKIDRSFVANVASSARDRALAQAISEMGRALGIRVVAEGVETEAQAAFFAGGYCSEVQGFLFGQPLPPEQLPHLLKLGIAPAELLGEGNAG